MTCQVVHDECDVCRSGRLISVLNLKLGAMNIPKVAFAVACGLSVWATAPAFAEDLTIVYKATDGVGSTSAKYLSSMRTRDDRGPYTTSLNKVLSPYSNIVDMILGKDITIDHQKKEYWEETPQESEALTQLAKQQLEKQTAKLKETYAKMGEKPPPFQEDTTESAALEKLSDHRTIAGYDCEHYVITLTHSLNGKVMSAA